jgi:hypothetical protein
MLFSQCADALYDKSFVLLVAVGKIQPKEVGSSLHQPFDAFPRVAGRSDGGDDFGMAEHGG